MKPKSDARTASGKRVYRAPVLRVHGDLKKLTTTKAGTTADGAGKPATRISGGST